jgi:hypothetical protein
LIQLVRLVEVVKDSPGVGVALLELLDGFGQAGFETGALVANGSKFLGRLGFGPVRVHGQLDVPVLSAPVEAWDLRRGNTVYAVKFGTAQKLHYVCDQALATLELLRNKAEVKEVAPFDRYCLWLGYRAKKMPADLVATGSIILKQKVEAWARKANELGVVPVIRLSHNVVKGIDQPDEEDT